MLSNYITKKLKCCEELAGFYKEMAVLLSKQKLIFPGFPFRGLRGGREETWVLNEDIWIGFRRVCQAVAKSHYQLHRVRPFFSPHGTASLRTDGYS
jgi:hypothetical protein